MTIKNRKQNIAYGTPSTQNTNRRTCHS